MPTTDFFDTIQALPFWQSSLLAHLDPINAIDRLKQLLKTGKQPHLFLAVSDGGATKGNLRSFRWEPAIGKTNAMQNAETSSLFSSLTKDSCQSFVASVNLLCP
jgi:hypothetical protein